MYFKSRNIKNVENTSFMEVFKIRLQTYATTMPTTHFSCNMNAIDVKLHISAAVLEKFLSIQDTMHCDLATRSNF